MNHTHPTHVLGEQAENAASRNLTERGFHIIERNWSRRMGEIDIIATNSGIIHFIEVKGQARERVGFAAHARADTAKMRRVRRTALAWLAEHGYGPDTSWQLDIIEVTLGDETAHIRHFLGVTV